MNAIFIPIIVIIMVGSITAGFLTHQVALYIIGFVISLVIMCIGGIVLAVQAKGKAAARQESMNTLLAELNSQYNCRGVNFRYQVIPGHGRRRHRRGGRTYVRRKKNCEQDLEIDSLVSLDLN